MPACAARCETTTAAGTPHSSATISLLRWLSQKRSAASGSSAIESSSTTNGRTLQSGSSSAISSPAVLRARPSARRLEDRPTVLAAPLEDEREKAVFGGREREGEVGRALQRFGERHREAPGLALDQDGEVEGARLVHEEAEAPAPGVEALAGERESDGAL